jgi:uncharacterized surface protein with fasciclin (FAS1) repeats
MKKITIVLFAIIASLIGCSKNDGAPNPPTPKTIFGVLEDDSKSAKPEFTILTTAIKRTQLITYLDNSSAKITFFAPTDEAFKAYFKLKGTTVDTEFASNLYTLLSYHMIPNKILKNADFTTGYFKTNAEGPILDTYLSIYINKSSIDTYINAYTTVLSTDIMASNGVIHVVNNVIERPTVKDAIRNNFDFNDFYNKINSQPIDVQNILTDATPDAPITLLALKDKDLSFVKQLDEVKFTTLLKNQILNGNYYTDRLKDGQLIETLGAKKIKIKKTPTYISLIDDSTFESDLKVSDVQCTNGVLHIISKPIEFK